MSPERFSTTAVPGSDTSSGSTGVAPRSVEQLWFGDAWWAKAGRAALTPASVLFQGIVATRNWLYDHNMLAVIPSAIPTLSVGNISVGGTGKTPVAAYFVQRFLDAGRIPALVMRGYGNDEPEVHRILNPNIRVYTNPDRAAGIAQAVTEGANVVVLDDAFQHRRAERHADVVLVSAERWRDGEHVLPAGSLREMPRALGRATLIVVTHKVAPPETVARVAEAIQKIVPNVPVASMRLRPDALREGREGGDRSRLSLESLAGERVLGIAGVGDPESFFRQLESVGAIVTRAMFPDHHPFTVADGEWLTVQANDHKYIVSTLKDSVKLRHVWPPKGPHLWYVSQAVEVSAGSAFIDATIGKLLL